MCTVRLISASKSIVPSSGQLTGPQGIPPAWAKKHEVVNMRRKTLNASRIPTSPSRNDVQKR
eukprot:2254507-Pyramimonas_sp.AAC.1